MNTTNAATHELELPALPAATAGGPSLLSGNLDVISNVKVKLSVRVGDAIVSVHDLMHMKEDHVLTLSQLLDAPVDVLLDGSTIARGHLVAVDDNFGVRITELPQAARP